MSAKYFDLVGTIHGREYSDHGQYVTADDYYHLKLYSEAVDRLKLGMEIELENLKTENERLLQLPTRNALIKAREQLIDERDQLKAENEELKHKISAGAAREWDLRSQVRAAKESRARAVQLSKDRRMAIEAAVRSQEVKP